MAGRRHVVCGAFCLVALVATLCASGDRDAVPEEAASATAPSPGDAAFAAEAERLCAPAAELHASLYDTRGAASFEKAQAAFARAEADLAASLRDLDPPEGLERELGEYADLLERSAELDSTASDTSGPPERYMERVVESAKTGLRMEEAAVAAELPDVCPPPPGVDVHNTLFVATANRECMELVIDVQAAGALEAPGTAEEVRLVLELGRRLGTGITKAIERSRVPGIEGLPLDQIARLNGKRLAAIDAVEQSFADADFGAYRKAAKELLQASRAADRRMNEVGLFWCGKAFRRIPL